MSRSGKTRQVVFEITRVASKGSSSSDFVPKKYRQRICRCLFTFLLIVFVVFNKPPLTFGQTPRIPVMIEVQNYIDYRSQLAGKGPFYVYGWLVDGSIGQFDSKVNSLASLANDSQVQIRSLMFSSYTNLAAKIPDVSTAQELKNRGIDGVFLNSEPGLTTADNFNDIFLESETNNLVVKFARYASNFGFQVFWGPLRRNLDTHASDSVSETALEMMFRNGLIGVGLQ